jgi:hypothetical protein
MRRSSLDILVALAGPLHTPRTPAVPRPAIQLSVSRARLAPQNAAVVEACVPLVALKGDSYRLKDRDLARTPTTPTD